MIKRKINCFAMASILAASLLFSCTSVERDNPFDSGGKNYKGGHSSSVVPSGCENAGISYSCSISGYKTVKIGSQTWMAENLNCDVEGSVCYGEKGNKYVGVDEDNNPIYEKYSPDEIQANCDRYGRLYDWCTAMAVCPRSWHLPSDDEWKELVDFVVVDAGGSTYAGLGDSYAGRYLKADSGWSEYGNGEDKYGFAALPGGYTSDASYMSVGTSGLWWSATENAALYGYAYARHMIFVDNGAGRNDIEKNPRFRSSVRCVRD